MPKLKYDKVSNIKPLFWVSAVFLRERWWKYRMKTGISKKLIFKREKTTLFCAVHWSVHQMLHTFHVWRFRLLEENRVHVLCSWVFRSLWHMDKYFLPRPNLRLKKIAWETQLFSMQKVRLCMFPELLRLPTYKYRTPVLRRFQHVPKYL